MANDEQVAITNRSHDDIASRSHDLLKHIAELEAEVAFLRHQKISCCVCGAAFDIQYTCPRCAMATPIRPHPQPFPHIKSQTDMGEGGDEL